LRRKGQCGWLGHFGPIELHTAGLAYSFMQWAAANCAALPTANAGQFTISHCK